MKATYLLSLCFLLGAINISAQRFSARADVKKIPQNGTFNVTYSFDNMDDQGFEKPDFSPFNLIAGPAKSVSTSMYNGVISKSSSYTYTLLATEVGKFTIPPAKARYNGKSISSTPLTIEVLKQTTQGNIVSDETGKFLIKVEIDYPEAYIGQQILLDYTIYVQSDISQFGLVNEPNYDGFFNLPVTQHNFPTNKVEINGESYFSKVMKRVALYPQQKGTFTIDPIMAEIGVPDPNKRNRGFFSSRRLRTIKVVTEPVSITINSLPEPKPMSFSGAIGDFQLKNTINKNTITTDDAVVLTQEVRGDGDDKTIVPSNIDFSDDWEVYEPKVTFEKTDEYAGKFYTVKRFEYLLVPRKTGTINLVAGYTYFDPDSAAYVTLKGDVFQVRVNQGNRSVTSDKRDVAPINDIADVEDDGSRMTKSAIQVPKSWWLLGMSILAIVLSFIAYLKYKLILEDRIDPEEKKRIKAEKKAREQLKSAEEFMNLGNQRAFFDEVSKTITRYLSEKYAIPFADQSKHKITLALVNKGLDQENIDEYLSILQSCEMALFAGQSSDKVNEVYQKAVQLITKVG